MTLTPAASFARRYSIAEHEANRFDGLRSRAQDLREKSTSLLELEQELRASGRDLNNRELELDAKAEALRKLESKLAKREGAILDREVDAIQARHAAPPPSASGASAFSADRAVPSDKIALAERIVHMGRVRRGEVSLVEPLPDAPPGSLVRNALIALNRPVPVSSASSPSHDQHDRWAREQAAKILAAGAKRRGQS